MRNGSRRGLFHPSDINTFGLLSTSPGPASAPLPNVDATPKSTRSTSGAASSKPSSRPHSRSASLAGSLGRADAVRAIASQSEFDKYMEDPDEDYEDVFGIPNTTGSSLLVSWRFVLLMTNDSIRQCYEYAPIKHQALRQILGQLPFMSVMGDN